MGGVQGPLGEGAPPPARPSRVGPEADAALAPLFYTRSNTEHWSLSDKTGVKDTPLIEIDTSRVHPLSEPGLIWI